MQFHSLIDALQEALHQELLLVSALTPEQYTASPQGHFKSGVGKHLRHNLDHFEAFFAGLNTFEIDYETRSRSGQIEDIPGVAEAAIREYISKLDMLRNHAEAPLKVREESEAGTQERRWLTSSIGRELQFLLGHSVHHNAIIAMIVDHHGVELPTGFGVAPSTQRHEAQSPPVQG